MRWKFRARSTKLNRGSMPMKSAISPSSRSRSTTTVFWPVSRWIWIARLVATVVEPEPPLALKNA